jgi:hypothetical protein
MSSLLNLRISETLENSMMLNFKALKSKRRVHCLICPQSAIKVTRVFIKSLLQELSIEKTHSSMWTLWDPVWKIGTCAQTKNLPRFQLACKLQCIRLNNVKHSNFQTTPKFRSQLLATQDTEWATSRRTFMERTTATALSNRKWCSAWPSEPLQGEIIGRTW